MDKIIFPAKEPIELEIRKYATTQGSGEIVEMTLLVFVPSEGRERQIRLEISPEHADHMAAQLRAGAITARRNLRRR